MSWRRKSWRHRLNFDPQHPRDRKAARVAAAMVVGDVLIMTVFLSVPAGTWRAAVAPRFVCGWLLSLLWTALVLVADDWYDPWGPA